MKKTLLLLLGAMFLDANASIALNIAAREWHPKKRMLVIFQTISLT